MKKMKASREEIDQSIKDAFNMNRQESNEKADRKSLSYYLGDTEDEVEEQPTGKSSIKGNRLPRSNSFRAIRTNTAHRERSRSETHQR